VRATGAVIDEPARQTSAAAGPIRIIIADEEPILRDGLRRLLETSEQLRIAGIAAISDTAALVLQLMPDILLLGLSPGACGDPALDAIHASAAAASVRTILLTKSVESADVLKARRVGACGVVPKDSTAETLFQCIDSVAAGQYWVGRQAVTDIETGLRLLDSAQRRTKAFGLTRRELEIVRAVMSGETNNQIAERFSISKNTVKSHLMNIFNKVGASTRVELALFAAHHQMLDA